MPSRYRPTNQVRVRKARNGIAYLEVSWEWPADEPTRYQHIRCALPAMHDEHVYGMVRIMQHAHDAMKAEMNRDRQKYDPKDYLDGGLAAFDPEVRRARRRLQREEWARKVLESKTTPETEEDPNDTMDSALHDMQIELSKRTEEQRSGNH